MREKVWNPDRIADQLQMRAIQQRRPLSCTLELTYRCNFRCRMCYVRMTDEQAAPYGRMRTVDEWLDMARQLHEAGVLYLTLTGGECTVYPGFEQLYERLSGMGFRVSLMTNAGSYTDSVRDVFRRFPPSGASITLYGGSNETYGTVTGDPRGFDKVKENIRFLQSIGVPVGLNFTMIRQNVQDYPKVSAFCNEAGLPYTLITDITEHRYDASFSDALNCRLNPAERAVIACTPPEKTAEAMEKAAELMKELADFRMPGASNESLNPEPDRCIGSHTGCAIFWNGDMQTCISMYGYRHVKPFEIGFEAAWTQLKAGQNETFRRPEACRECGMSEDCLHNCAGRRFEGTGSPLEPDPYTCQYTYLLRRCKSRQKAADVPDSPKCV